MLLQLYCYGAMLFAASDRITPLPPPPPLLIITVVITIVTTTTTTVYYFSLLTYMLIGKLIHQVMW